MMNHKVWLPAYKKQHTDSGDDRRLVERISMENNRTSATTNFTMKFGLLSRYRCIGSTQSGIPF